MNLIINKIDSVLDPLINFHYTKTRERLELADTMPKYFDREFLTIKVDPGRQTGKTWYIARTATPKDIVIVRNLTVAKELHARINQYNPCFIPVYSIKQTTFTTHETIDRLWIDDASYISPEDLDRVYEHYSGLVKQYVLIG